MLKINFKKLKILFNIFLNKKYFKNNYYYKIKRALHVHKPLETHTRFSPSSFFPCSKRVIRGTRHQK
jgi:hypothetical protein